MGIWKARLQADGNNETDDFSNQRLLAHTYG